MVIRVFVYDDSKERRESLKAFIGLQDNLKLVGDAEDCTHVLTDIETYNPHVVLMDINMPNVDGIRGLKLIKTTYPEVKVLMQTAFDDSDKIFTCISNGASGYILKNDKPQRILQAIEEVYEGGAAMNPAIAQKVLDYFKPSSTKSPLSPKENNVLALLAEGFSYKMVADKLGVSYTTINTHTKRIYEKLHISSLGEAIAWYYKNIN
jgi:DNA-binding NarL/FixJ family response regulator